MSTETPGQGGAPDPGQPQQAAQPTPPDSPTEPVPPAPATGAPAWATPPDQATIPPAPGSWGAPASPGMPPAGPAQQPPPGPWGAPQQPQQPSQGGWGPPQQPQPGWDQAPAGWAPPQPARGNGCLRACLIVAIIGFIVLVIGMIGIIFLGGQLVTSMGINSDGTLRQCPFVSDSRLAASLGTDVHASELTGFFDATVGRALDKRVLGDATDCWVAEGTNTTAGFGRIALYNGSDAASRFQEEHAQAADAYLAQDLTGVGDEAFCTGVSDTGMSGVLVRRGDTLVYVSLLDTAFASGDGFQTSDTGVLFSPQTCRLAQQVAAAVLP